MTAPSWWRAPLLTAICMGAAAAISNAPLPARARTAFILGLAALAVGVSLAGSMGLRRASWAVRAIILVPIALCVGATVVLTLESAFRAGLVLR